MLPGGSRTTCTIWHMIPWLDLHYVHRSRTTSPKVAAGTGFTVVDVDHDLPEVCWVELAPARDVRGRGRAIRNRGP